MLISDWKVSSSCVQGRLRSLIGNDSEREPLSRALIGGPLSAFSSGAVVTDSFALPSSGGRGPHSRRVASPASGLEIRSKLGEDGGALG